MTTPTESNEPRWLPYVAPLAIIAVSAACAAFTASVQPPRQAFAAENDAAMAQLMEGIRDPNLVLSRAYKLILDHQG